jgi:hypothetical protein
MHEGNSEVSQLAELEGAISMDVEDLAPLLPEGLAESLRLANVKSKCLFEGSWQANSLLPAGFFFKGAVRSEQWQVAGYLLNNLTASAEITPKQVRIKDLIIQDISGRLDVPEALLTRSKGHSWLVSAPDVTITDFTPTALRRPLEPVRHRRHDISFSKIALTGFSGDIGYPKSYIAEGMARFTHSSRRKTGKGFRGFTSDLMSKMGLDIDILAPPNGTVEYQIRDGKIVLTRLKDVYSQGKLAKFSLPKGAKPSTIAFDGDLDVTIKLRPYQPLLKVTDKVTLNIQGSLKKPVVTLD